MLRKYLVQMPRLLFRKRPAFILIVQSFIIVASLVLAFLLRFDFSLPYRKVMLTSGVLLLAIRLLTLRLFGLNHGWWSFTSVAEALDIIRAVVTGSLAFFLINRYAFGVVAFPRSVYLLEGILTAGLLGTARLLSRVLAESARRDYSTAKHVLVVGAGFAGQMLLREFSHPGSGYCVVGCVDDDPSKQGIQVHGVSVLGTIDRLKDILAIHPADEILIAIPSATGEQMQRIIAACQATNLPFKTVPTLRDIVRGDAMVSELREVRLEDLLGREPVHMDLESVRRHLEGRNVLVTGSAGSIGSELCRQILAYRPSALICVDQNETGIFFQQHELQQSNGPTHLVFHVADVSDHDHMRHCFSEHSIDHVFHAAAYKHVPVMEENVAEAVRNNVLSLQQLLDIAEEAGSKSFLLISSDKAVNPTSVMGSTKRICELLLAARPKKHMRCVSVRFGNVLGSSGSVVPIFQEQLRRGRALTITHPDIRRFFMTTEEAVSLVLEAFTIGKDGDILVLEMGKPVKILDMARTLIRLSGKSADGIAIQFTGLREGEKLEEELFYEREEILPTSHEKIKRTNGMKPNWPLLCQQLEELRMTLNLDGAGPIRGKIKEIVPEYRCSDTSTGQGTPSKPALYSRSVAVGK